jgi:CRISPR-associated endonuclease Cas2
MRAIVCYDFSDDKARARFCKIVQKYGFRVQYSVFEFKLDRQTWQKFVLELQEKKFLNGNHNIIIIPITEGVHKKIVKLGNVFMAFDYDTLIFSGSGILGIGEKNQEPKKPRIDIDKLMNI